MPYYLYILQMADGRYYTGITSDLNRRESQHGKDPLTHTTLSFGSGPIVYHEVYPDRIEARKREVQIKNWSHAKKKALIQGDLRLLKTLAKCRS